MNLLLQHVTIDRRARAEATAVAHRLRRATGHDLPSRAAGGAVRLSSRWASRRASSRPPVVLRPHRLG
jgi:hypothetical protein